MARSIAHGVGSLKCPYLLCALALAGCAGGEGAITDFAVPPNPFGFDAGTSVDRTLPNYELVDIADNESCERLPLGPGLLAPYNPTNLLCTRHADCAAHDLCSARIACERQPGNSC